MSEHEAARGHAFVAESEKMPDHIDSHFCHTFHTNNIFWISPDVGTKYKCISSENYMYMK